MEKQVNKILAFLPKAATAVTFQVSPPISPAGKGPMVSLIPKEARRKSIDGSFDAREPTSPKVSCFGQIKCRRKKESWSNLKHVSPPPEPSLPLKEVKRKKKPLLILRMLKGTKRDHEYVAEGVPSLGHMKQFSAARDRLSNFDWRAYEATETAACLINPLYEEKGVKNGKDEKEFGNGVGVVGQMRKYNLWKR